MEFLVTIGKFRILDQILSDHIVIVSAVKVKDYLYATQQQLNKYPGIRVLDQDEEFPTWCQGKKRNLTDGDLSSIYLAMQNKGSHLVCTEEDFYLEETARQHHVNCLSESDFVIRTINDERLIQLYHLTKKVS
ncbi:MAG: hypothetical protein ACTHMD_09645 [Flavisolibacter sp.]